MLNAGSSKLVTTHMNKYSVNVQNNRRKLRTGKGQSDVTPFDVQSIGSNLDLSYTIGKFTIEPQLYLDYYLHASTTSRFTQVYNILFAFDF
jgi:hypothetical protein